MPRESDSYINNCWLSTETLLSHFVFMDNLVNDEQRISSKSGKSIYQEGCRDLRCRISFYCVSHSFFLVKQLVWTRLKHVGYKSNNWGRVIVKRSVFCMQIIYSLLIEPSGKERSYLIILSHNYNFYPLLKTRIITKAHKFPFVYPFAASDVSL